MPADCVAVAWTLWWFLFLWCWLKWSGWEGWLHVFCVLWLEYYGLKRVNIWVHLSDSVVYLFYCVVKKGYGKRWNWEL